MGKVVKLAGQLFGTVGTVIFGFGWPQAVCVLGITVAATVVILRVIAPMSAAQRVKLAVRIASRGESRGESRRAP